MPKGRLRGACLQCARRKRKCDHKQPQCTQCAKHGQTCELQTFKVSTPSVFNLRQVGRRPFLETQSSQPASEMSASQASSGTPAPPSLPEAPVHQDAFSMKPTPEILSDATALPTSPTTTLLEAMLGPPRPGSSNIDSSFLSRDDPHTDTFASSSHFTFTDLATDPGPNESIDIDNSSLFSMLPLNIDDDVLEITRRDIMLDAAELLGSLRNMSEGTFFEPLPEFVPNNLYCPMPWPADMLASSERRFLWQYFLGIAEADFLCLDWKDVGHLYGFQHPYITTLPRMALSNDALRGAIFCFAASQYQLRHGRPDFETTKDFASSEAALALRTQMTQSANDSDLLSMISAATLLHWYGTKPHDYLRVASQLVSQYLARATSIPNTITTSLPEVSLTEFRWSVVSTLCSLQQPRTLLGDQGCRMIEMSENEVKQNYSRAFQHWVSHPIYSFSPRLVNPLLRIGMLLQTQLLQLESADAPPDDPSWTSRVSEAEEMLLQARDCDVNASKSALGSADPVAVLALNESMYATGAILLYARIHGLPPTAPFIRRQARTVVEEITNIPADSRVSFAIVFPLFIAGCEAVEQQMRDTIIERLRDPGGVTYVRGDLAGALRHIWDIRDLEPGLPWPHWVKKVEPRYRISCLM